MAGVLNHAGANVEMEKAMFQRAHESQRSALKKRGRFQITPIPLTRSICLVFGYLLLSCCLTTSVHATDISCGCNIDDKYPTFASLPALFRTRVDYVTRYEEYYVARSLDIIREGGQTRQWIDQTDVDVMKQKFADGQRRAQLEKLLAMDANFDGQVAAGEVRTYYANTSGQPPSEATLAANTAIDKYDVDHDGIITLKEMNQVHPEDFSRSPVTWWNTMAEWLALDPDKDGKLTVPELTCLAKKAFHTIDTNGDGFISSEEADALQKASKPATLKP